MINPKILQLPQSQRLTKLWGTTFPVVQGGMVWVSGARLAAAVSETGCLGLLGAGSMNTDVLNEHILKTKSLTNKPFGVNIPLLYQGAHQQIEIALRHGIKIFFTSAGSPYKFTADLKREGCTVVHVASSVDLALKCEQAGVDAVVLEGFEAGGHNGRDELTTLVLLQQALNSSLTIPVIAAGGIGSGTAIVAALALGASGVQIGTLFAAAQESSAHEQFKKSLVDAPRNATFLRLKKIIPARLLHNSFSQTIAELEAAGANEDVLRSALGKGRARRGIFEGDLQEGELEIGQIVSEVTEIYSASQIVERLLSECEQASLKLFLNPAL